MAGLAFAFWSECGGLTQPLCRVVAAGATDGEAPVHKARSAWHTPAQGGPVACRARRNRTQVGGEAIPAAFLRGQGTEGQTSASQAERSRAMIVLPLLAIGLVVAIVVIAILGLTGVLG